MTEDILEIMRCKNCKNYTNCFCKERNKNTKPDDTCSFFDKSPDFIYRQNLLKNPNLFNIITEGEFNKKIVGEIEARKTIFLVANMKLVENLNKATDNLMLNALSGAGKDYITETIFEILPNEEKEELIRITPKVLAYTRNKAKDKNATWKKISLRLEDIDNAVLNDGSFKVLSSANPNKINKSKVVIRGKDVDFHIEGKPSIVLTIANPNPQEELLRRYPNCNLDEGRNQTKEILKRHAEYSQKGKSTEYNFEITEALRQLKRVLVKVPFADKLIKLFSPENIIVRTHFQRFLDYIKTSCAIYQYQRKQDEDGYFIAEPQDYDIARIPLIKTTNNILMIPLTKLQKDLLAVFEKQNLERVSIDDLSDFKEIQKLNITNEWLRRQIDYLVSKTFLLKDKEKRYDEAGKIIPKPVFVYSYNRLQRLEIPLWKDLDEFTSNTSDNKNTSISSITSNTQINEVNEVKEQEMNITPIEVIKINSQEQLKGGRQENDNS